MSQDLTDRRPARERLLDVADELFFQEGIHTVGIDRILERSGVAKATLYSTFGSKDELVRAYLQGRRGAWRARMDTGLVAFSTPRARLLGVFDLLVERATEPGFRGCAFVNASAESPAGSVAETESDAARAERIEYFRVLATDARVKDPEAVAALTNLLYDGALVGSRMDRTADAARLARSVLEATLGSERPPRGRAATT